MKRPDGNVLPAKGGRGTPPNCGGGGQPPRAALGKETIETLQELHARLLVDDGGVVTIKPTARVWRFRQALGAALEALALGR